MRFIRHALLPAAAALGLLSGPAALLSAQDAPPGVGDPAPVVTIPDLSGTRVDLGRYLGRQPVFLEFWATWCPLCKAMMPRVRAARERYGKQVAFVGVNVAVNQTPERVRRYVQKEHPPFQVLYDDDGVSQRAYDPPSTSYVVIVNRAGKIVYTGVGSDQKFEDALQQVTAAR